MDIAETMDNVIVQMVEEEHAVMPVKWILVAEYLTDDGESWAVSASSQDSTVWDRMGLLDFALTEEKKKVAS